MASRDDMLFSRARYRGEVKPENLVFNANLQEFVQRISYLCNLETNGKISSKAAFEEIKILWQRLEASKEQLHVGENPFQGENGNG